MQELRFRLSYADCDPAQVVYYAAFYPWFERVSSEFWLQHGVRIDRLREEHGVAFISRASGCEYLKPTRLYDLLAVCMYFGRVGSTSLTFSFDVLREPDRELVVTGFNTVVVIDAAGNPVPVPDSLRSIAQSDPSQVDRHARHA